MGLPFRRLVLPTTEIQESNVQFHGSWRHMARNSPKGEVLDTPEVYIASSNVPWSIMNASFLSAPVETEAALERSVSSAERYFTARKLGWVFILCEDWLAPELRAKAPVLLEAQGLKLAMNSMGMVADRISPPTRPQPPLRIRQLTQEECQQHVTDINAFAYDVPLAVARGSVTSALFQGETRGYAGFADGKAVSVAVVSRSEDVVYVSWVATRAEYRGRGYAEAVMRQGLDEARQVWGLERTVLHATDAGHPVYLRMGYRDVSRFGFYAPAAPKP